MASRINPRITAKGGATRRAMAFLWLAGLGLGPGLGLATAEEVPLPKPRPSIWIEPHTFREAAGPDFDSAHVTSAPTECDQRIRAIATIEPMPRLIGPESCGGEDMVRLDAVTRSGGVRIDLKPAPVLRCMFAESVAAWLRDEAAPRVEKLGAALRAVETYDSYECRGRNRVPGAKLSEHGKGNAVDLRSFILADGRVVALTDVSVAKDFRDELRESACHRFTTVLGPGSDSAHESHIHVDLIERRGGYRMCQWDVRTPPPKEVAAEVPLPTPRPNIDSSTPSRKM